MVAVAATVSMAACGSQAKGPVSASASTALSARSALPSASPMVAAPLVDANLDLRAGPVPVPLELQIPSLRLKAPVPGVGITSKNVMDTPTGSASDPVWQKVFWYRGGGAPGEESTATI